MFWKSDKTNRHPRGRWPISIVLAGFYTLSAILILFFATGFLYWFLERNLEAEDDRTLSDEMEILRLILKEKPNDLETLKSEVQWEGGARRFTKYYARVINPLGKVVLATTEMDVMVPSVEGFPKPAPATKFVRKGRRWKSPEGKEFVLMSSWAEMSNGPPYLVQIALDDTPDEAALSSYRHMLVLVLLLGILVSAVVGVAVARRGMRPLREITKVAQNVTASRLHERITPANWPRELMALATALDEMLGRLENSFRQLSQFSADIAHEFRTPLSALRVQAEVALSRSRTAEEYRPVLESSLEEYERLSRMIDSLLFLARAENAETVLQRTRFDSVKEIRGVVDFYEALAAEKKIVVTVEGEGILEADSILFRRAISNLLANSLRHTSVGGEVKLAVRNNQPAEIRVEISDNGEGVPPEHLAKVFDRFYRVDPSRTEQGSGLGLAIVKLIMQLHGGGVAIQSKVASGTTIILKFPSLASGENT